MPERALYLSTLEEEAGWSERLLPLRHLGVRRLDITAAVVPESYWIDIPPQLRSTLLTALGDRVLPHLERLAVEAEGAFGSSRAILPPVPGDRGVVDTAVGEGVGLLVVPFAGSSLPTVVHNLVHCPVVPTLFLRDDHRLCRPERVLVPWSDPLECSPAVDILGEQAAECPLAADFFHCSRDHDPGGPGLSSLVSRRLGRSRCRVSLLEGGRGDAGSIVEAAGRLPYDLVLLAHPGSGRAVDYSEGSLWHQVVATSPAPTLVVPRSTPTAAPGPPPRPAHRA